MTDFNGRYANICSTDGWIELTFFNDPDDWTSNIYTRRFTLHEICHHELDEFEDTDRAIACAQLRAINAWVALTSIALVLKCTKFGNDHRYMCKQTTKAAFLTSAFCLLGGILWFYMGSPICQVSMTESKNVITSFGDSMKATIGVLVLQFCLLFRTAIVLADPKGGMHAYMAANSDDEQKKIEKNPPCMAFKMVVYILLS